jgi:enoyl-CoA hydratase/carnithine racemase
MVVTERHTARWRNTRIHSWKLIALTAALSHARLPGCKSTECYSSAAVNFDAGTSPAARVMSGTEAADFGLVVAETYDSAEELVEAAQALAKGIAANAPLGVREAKRMFDEIEHLALKDALEHSRAPRMALNDTRDFMEGVCREAQGCLCRRVMSPRPV